MNKSIKNKKIFSIIMSILMSLSIIFPISNTASNTVYALDNKRIDTSINYTGNYYDSLGGLNKLLNNSYKKEDVKEGLRALIGYSKSGTFSGQASDKYIKAFNKTISGTDKKHPKYGGTSGGSLAYLWQESERKVSDNEPAGHFRLFYSNVYGNSLSNYSSSVVNREHVWPQSLSGGLFGTTGAGADIHHVRPCNGKLNNVRSNKPYADLSNNNITTTYYVNSNTFSNYNSAQGYLTPQQVKSQYKGEITGYSSSRYFEPTDNYKGDIARIFAYLIVHYPSLENLINNVIVGGTKTLVEWNTIDEVDSYEIQRNNVGYNYQGNRNPFIDAPGLIDEIWGDGSNTQGPNIPDIPPYSSESNEYKLVTNENEIVTGSEIIVTAKCGAKEYALTDNNVSGGLKATNISVNNSRITTENESIKWKVNRTSNGVTLSSKENSKNYLSCPSTGSTKVILSNVGTTFNIGKYGSRNGIYIISKNGRGLLYNNSINGFKNYALNNIGSNGYASEMNIYIKKA